MAPKKGSLDKEFVVKQQLSDNWPTHLGGSCDKNRFFRCIFITSGRSRGSDHITTSGQINCQPLRFFCSYRRQPRSAAAKTFQNGFITFFKTQSVNSLEVPIPQVLQRELLQLKWWLFPAVRIYQEARPVPVKGLKRCRVPVHLLCDGLRLVWAQRIVDGHKVIGAVILDVKEWESNKYGVFFRSSDLPLTARSGGVFLGVHGR